MEYNLKINISPAGAGGVKIKPSGKYLRPGQVSYPTETVLTLTAVTYASGAKFNHWEGDITGTTDTVTLTMDSDKSVTAVFSMPSRVGGFELTTLVMGSGSVTPGNGMFSPGDQTILVATPDTGNTFVSWSGDTDGCTPVQGSPNTLLVVMNRNRHIIATFQVQV